VAEKPKPYFLYETRYLRDSVGRRIEFQQLLPGSPDPGPEHFHEFIGLASVNLVINGMSNPLPIRFNIPGVKDVLQAFKVFDALAQKAAEDAKAKVESGLLRAQLTAGGRAGAAAGLGTPGANGGGKEPRRLIELG
jgi:hypothetical protein